MTISWFSKNIPHNSVTNGDNRELIAKNQRVSSHGVRARTVCVRVNRRDTSFLSLSFSPSPPRAYTFRGVRGYVLDVQINLATYR